MNKNNQSLIRVIPIPNTENNHSKFNKIEIDNHEINKTALILASFMHKLVSHEMNS